MKTRLKGKRYINLLRCSTMDQAETSIPDQKSSCDDFAKEHGLIHHDDVESKGVSGSRSVTRKDINGIIEKKRNGGNFEIVLVHDLSRLTRAGIVRGHELRNRLSAVGLTVISVGENLPEEDDERELIESVIYYKNHKFSKNQSTISARGLVSSYLEGRRPATMTTPYGFDRLYVGHNGIPVALLRNMGGGIRHLLDPKTLNVDREFYRGQGTAAQFRKQKTDTSKLVPSIAERVDVIREIFHRHYIEGWGATDIARALNSRKVTPPTASFWNKITIGRMLHNEAYLGKSVLCRVTTGWFNMLSVDRPQPTSTNAAELEELGLGHKPPTRRSHEEWLSPNSDVEQPVVPLIVDPICYGIAEKKIADFWSRWEIKRTDGATRDRHRNSSYVLKGILRSLQGNYPMRGAAAGTYRYYKVMKPAETGELEPPLDGWIRADPLEMAVLEAIQKAILSCSHVESLIDEHIKEKLRNEQGSQKEFTKLTSAAASMRKRIEFFYETSDIDGNDKDFKETLFRMKDELRRIESQISELNAAADDEPVDPIKLRAFVIQRLQHISENYKNMPRQQLRSLLMTIIRNMTVDMDSQDLSFDVCLPKWSSEHGCGLRLDQRLLAKTLMKAQDDKRLILWHIWCDYHRKNRKSRPFYEVVVTAA